MEENEDEVITIHIDNEDGKTIGTIDVHLSELVELYMNTHFPLRKVKHLN